MRFYNTMRSTVLPNNPFNPIAAKTRLRVNGTFGGTSMNLKQLETILCAGLLLIVTTGGVIYFRSIPKGKRIWAAVDSTGRFLAAVFVVAFGLWFCFALVVRPWAAVVGFEGHWVLGMAPSLFAGIAVTAWIASTWRHRPLLVLIYGSTSITLIEVIQLWLPKYVFDPRDVLAGLIGSALLTLALSLALHRKHALSSSAPNNAFQRTLEDSRR
jgi:hypothetical protein